MGKRLTVKEILARFEGIHEKKYDYKEFIYSGDRKKSTIICLEHGAFEQTPFNHKQGQGCPKCGKEKAAKSRKYTKKEVMTSFVEVHGCRYDYSKVEYSRCDIKVEITCKDHGVFLQAPVHHKRGVGCPKCGHLKTTEGLVKTQKSVIEEFEEVHGKKYDYSLVDYSRSVKKVIIICKSHGKFEQRAENHREGKGCPKCGFEKIAEAQRLTSQISISQFEEVHGDKYDYSLVDYKRNKGKVKIICREHGVFEQEPNSHKSGRGCKKCGERERIKSRTFTRLEVIKQFVKIHGNKYDYSEVEYLNGYSSVKIMCKNHGVFNQIPNSHKRGNGCPKCKSSKGEDKVREYLKGKVEFKEQYSLEDCRDKYALRFDFGATINDQPHLIEFQGEQHYIKVDFWGGQKGLENRQYKDQLKRDFCKENGIPLLEIRFDDEDWKEKLKIFLDIK